MPAVLITGASRGIGRATSLRLAYKGWDVIATVRRPEDGERLLADAPPDRIKTLELDVTDTGQVDQLPSRLPERLDALVNNAGVVVAGPMESLKAEDVRQQFDVNVVGPVAVTNAVLPRLRASQGRIVFVSSMSGRVSTPMTGAYNASKFALEAIADAWRLELRPWGISVSLVEPAMTDTDMWRAAPQQQDAAERAMDHEHRRLYDRHLDGMRKAIPRAQRMAKPVDTVAAQVERALTANKAKARYVVGLDAKAQAAVMAVIPQRLKDVALARATGTPTKN